MRRYTERIRSDSAPNAFYDVLMEDVGGAVQAVRCTCPDDAHRGHLRPCKHRKRAELVPAFRRARCRLIRAGVVPGHRSVTDESLRLFGDVFGALVQQLVDRGRKPSDAVIAAIRDIIKTARALED